VPLFTKQYKLVPVKGWWGWEGNRRSGVALAVRHRLSGIPTYGFDGLRKGDEPMLQWVWHLYFYLKRSQCSYRRVTWLITHWSGPHHAIPGCVHCWHWGWSVMCTMYDEYWICHWRCVTESRRIPFYGLRVFEREITHHLCCCVSMAPATLKLNEFYV